MPYKGYVYKHQNKVNGKVYIGQTTQPLHIRWGKDGLRYRNQKTFFRAILMYGWDNFTHEVLEEINSDNKQILKQKLDEREAHYILSYESIRLEKGYNTAINNVKLKTTLSHKAKRIIEYYIKNNNMSLLEAYEAYSNYNYARKNKFKGFVNGGEKSKKRPTQHIQPKT